ncbi:MAG TPA: protein-L-isoaspartate O-methyltransferase [Nocardioidaceae bacterium]|nr:protein-L-isoaspartate O-methyltransferase [Nocardioidaceae bacterium]
MRSDLDAAFAAIRREDFLTEPERGYAADDRALPIGHGQTNSQPTTVRHLLSLLDAGHGDRVLDVGSGSGWTTALLGQLVGPQGSVHGTELVPELVEWSRGNLSAYDLPWISVEPAVPGELGLPARAPFDRILVSAETGDLPQQLVDQLAGGGRMVIPVGGQLLVASRDDRGELTQRRVGHYSFVPLR